MPKRSILTLSQREDADSPAPVQEHFSSPFLSESIVTAVSFDENSGSSPKNLNGKEQLETVDHAFSNIPESTNLFLNREENQNFIPAENQLQISNFTETNRLTESSNDSIVDSGPQLFDNGAFVETRWNNVRIEDELEMLKGFLTTLQENLLLGQILLLIIQKLRQSQNHYPSYYHLHSINNPRPQKIIL
jgi:hypothetical protein